MRRGWNIVITLTLFVAATAQAAPASGEFTAEGPILLPAKATVIGSPYAFFGNTSASLISLTVEASNMLLQNFSRGATEAHAHQRLLSVHDVEGDVEHQLSLTNASIGLVGGNHAGLWGIYPNAATTMTFSPGTSVSLEPRDASSIGSLMFSDEAEPDPGLDGYAREVNGPHVFAQAGGIFVFEGPLAMKLYGPDVRVAAAELDETFQTGRESSGDSVRSVKKHWVFLTTQNATVTIQTNGPVAFALGDSTIEWEGVATIANARGAISAPGGRFAATSGENLLLGGSLLADLHPTSDGSRTSVVMAIRGELQHTNARLLERVGAPGDASGRMLLPIVIGAAVVATGLAGYGGARVARRSRAWREAAAAAPPPLASAGEYTVEECVEAANLAAENERFQSALEWIQRARTEAPQSVRLLTDEGFFLQQTGDVDAALERYTEASRQTDSGEPDFLATALLMSVGAPSSDVEPWLIRALDRNPSFLFEFEDEASWAQLRTRPNVRSAIARAARVLGVG